MDGGWIRITFLPLSSCNSANYNGFHGSYYTIHPTFYLLSIYYLLACVPTYSTNYFCTYLLASIPTYFFTTYILPLIYGQSELIATNAPVGPSVHWMGCVFSFGARWGLITVNFFLLLTTVLFFFFFFVLGRFSWT